MDREFRYLFYRLKKKKNAFIVGVLGFVLLFASGIGLLGYVGYRAATATIDKLGSVEFSSEGQKAIGDAPGFIRDVIHTAAAAWVIESSAKNDVTKLKLVFACIDGLGGPEPAELIQLVRTKITDAALMGRIEELGSQLQNDPAFENGPSACANWVTRA